MTRCGAYHPDRGFVLVNALVLVVALAGVAVFLLARAEDARQRRAADNGAVQLNLYLDGFEALVYQRLAQNAPTNSDHLAEGWAAPVEAVELDRGTISGRVSDLQGRFNVNWLADRSDTASQASFAALLRRVGAPQNLGPRISAFLAPGNDTLSRSQDGWKPRSIQPGGPIADIEQLRRVAGMTPTAFARLQPYLAATEASSVNLNTASDHVLNAMMPGVPASAITQILQERRLRPFVSTGDFETRFAASLNKAALDQIEGGRLGVSSDWFELRAAATLEGKTARRITVFQRQPLPQGARVAYRRAIPDL